MADVVDPDYWNMDGRAEVPPLGMKGVEAIFWINVYRGNRLVYCDRTLFPECIGMKMRHRMLGYIANSYWEEAKEIMLHFGPQEDFEGKLVRWLKDSFPRMDVRKAPVGPDDRFTSPEEFGMFCALAEDMMLRASMRQHFWIDTDSETRH